jgi:hypothetical protein
MSWRSRSTWTPASTCRTGEQASRRPTHAWLDMACRCARLGHIPDSRVPELPCKSAQQTKLAAGFSLVRDVVAGSCTSSGQCSTWRACAQWPQWGVSRSAACSRGCPQCVPGSCCSAVLVSTGKCGEYRAASCSIWLTLHPSCYSRQHANTVHVCGRIRTSMLMTMSMLAHSTTVKLSVPASRRSPFSWWPTMRCKACCPAFSSNMQTPY